uniref:Prolyl-tRNA synthetase associated domain-containing protein 1 n=1 Tax=Danio rerio TaxID=7955 RepID=PRXD1_DANRE|nr:RecName: Full=Prolyl-tRNA synthetase associated domain-containing protein 1; AltName: Full=PrdX deacylase domain-containing protein 1 [Danio rerio]AAH57440.1 Zgc:64201 [Danio rerio]|eukprot:NP_956936.1 prolyl-tRNA synthetase associated domain-containing protein 1 [Danio rerio]
MDQSELVEAVSEAGGAAVAPVDLRKELEEFLKRLNIETTCIEHPEVFTVEEMMPHVSHLSGVVTKNLFLKDKKRRVFLVCVRHDRPLALGELSRRLGAPNLRLAEERLLLEKLRVRQGCVTPLALFLDTERSVTAVLDRELTHGGHTHIHCHPMTNSATMGITPADLLRFLEETQHTPVILSFD